MTNPVTKPITLPYRFRRIDRCSDVRVIECVLYRVATATLHGILPVGTQLFHDFVFPGHVVSGGVRGPGWYSTT